MFKLESNRLKREFKITNDNFYASRILNKYSDMLFVPDGNGCEFIVRFDDGSEFSSKGLPVTSSSEENEKLKFVFAEHMGVTVTLAYWVHPDGNTICKQITLSQSDDRVIDYVLLDNIGIINSKTHFGVESVPGSEIPEAWMLLGQPFYIDSLFFGCEFPAADSRIIHGAGQIKYYIGKNIGKDYVCPVTVMGGGKDNTIAEVKKAFFEYIDFISVKSDLRFQYNSWYDTMGKISADSISKVFAGINSSLKEQGIPQLDAYVVDDGWCNYKAKFWDFNKNFPNGMTDLSAQCRAMESSLGMWLGPSGGYSKNKSFAKKIQSGQNGYYNAESKDICVASSRYIDKLCDYLIETTKQYDLSYWKLDGFCLKPCRNAAHDHAVGGENDMYFLTDMWHKWTALFAKLRAARAQEGKDLWLNITCYVNPSPWLLQWVNSIWIQNSSDIGFAENIEDQARVEAEITYRDARYFDLLCRRSAQIPLRALYNHEPIYGKAAEVQYSDEEFEKSIFWCAVRGQALNELHLSPDMMNQSKWTLLASAMKFQRECFSVLKNGMFIGGDPEENNIYGYISWTEEGEGVIALRNPTNEKTSLTLTLNKLMGAPEDLSGVKRRNVYCKSVPETEQCYSYNDKMDLTLHPFEVMIFQLTK